MPLRHLEIELDPKRNFDFVQLFTNHTLRNIRGFTLPVRRKGEIIRQESTEGKWEERQDRKEGYIGSTALERLGPSPVHENLERSMRKRCRHE